MYRFEPIESKKIWGRELWLASTHPDGRQKDFYETIAGDYPLLIKIIEAKETLSVQVHPDDEKAALYENSKGKTECWYVLDAKENAQLVYGLNGVYSPSELRAAIKNNNLCDMLHYVDVKKGDFIYIPAGTVHAICGGLKLLEVQQSCNVTYRLYDWGRDRELHIEKGIAVIKPNVVRPVGKFPGVFSCPYFTLEDITVENVYTGTTENSGRETSPRDWTALFVIEGSGKISSNNKELAIKTDDLIMLSPGEEVTIEGDLHLMKVVCG
ncbi:MAG: class I mannose-6-phosphate isomerase [Treponema sp.]|nr:class I mannose-6-phosphate isomerase [Treponema sp.]